MRDRDDLNESGYRAQKPHELQRQVALDHNAQRGETIASAATAVPGRGTLSGTYGSSGAPLGPFAQLQKTMACVASDATNLEQANRAGDFMRASWAKAALERFIKQVPSLLAMVPGGAGCELEQNLHALVERARAALDNAPKISDAARAAADRGDYAPWRADLAAWSAQDGTAATAGSRDRAEPDSNPGPGSSHGESSPAVAPPLVEQHHDIATRGTGGSGGQLPHLETIQKAVERHDGSSVRAHVGGEAATSSPLPPIPLVTITTRGYSA